MFLVTKKIKGMHYLYITKSIRKLHSKTPSTITIEYIGRVEKYSEEEINKIKELLKNNDPYVAEYIEKLKQKNNSKKIPPRIHKKRIKKVRRNHIIKKKIKNKCAVGGFDRVVNLHHIIPTSEGGLSKEENLVYLCPNHHEMVHKGLIIEEELKKLYLRE